MGSDSLGACWYLDWLTHPLGLSVLVCEHESILVSHMLNQNPYVKKLKIQIR